MTSERVSMVPSRKEARIAGLLYLLVVLSGPFVLLYVPGRLFVAGDAAATAANILAHPTLYRAYVAIGLFSELAFVAVVLALYRLLKGVNAQLATLMALLILLDVPLALLGASNEVATFELLRDPGVLRVFDTAQRDALTLLMIEFGQKGVLVSEVFWGLWLWPLGALVFRSRFLPRFIGVWLALNGLAYVALSAIGLFWPQHAKAAFTLATPALFGEVALTLWLLVVGVRGPKVERPATRT